MAASLALPGCPCHSRGLILCKRNLDRPGWIGNESTGRSPSSWSGTRPGGRTPAWPEVRCYNGTACDRGRTRCNRNRPDTDKAFLAFCSKWLPPSFYVLLKFCHLTRTLCLVLPRKKILTCLRPSFWMIGFSRSAFHCYYCYYCYY